MKGVAAERKTDKCSNNIGANTGGINQEKLNNKKVYIGFEIFFEDGGRVVELWRVCLAGTKPQVQCPALLSNAQTKPFNGTSK